MPASAPPPRTSPAGWPLALLAVLLAAYLFAATVRSAGKSSDYTQDYISAKALFDGGSLYSPLSETAAGIDDKPRVRVNDHPPPYVVALSPLALLPHPTAYLVLSAVGFVAVVAAGLLLGVGRGWGFAGGWAVVVLLLLHPGTGVGMLHGNVSSLLLAVLVAAWWAARTGRSVLAGACVGFAAGVKLFPGLLGLAFVMTRDWRGALTAAVIGAGCWLGAAAAVGGGDVRAYVTERAPENARTFVPSAYNLSVAGVAHRTFGDPDPNTPWLERAAVRPGLVPVVLWLGRAAVVLLVVVGFVRTGRDTTPDRAFALLVPAMLLLSPLTWLHAVPMMALPVTYLAATATTRPRMIALGACVLALFVSDLWVALTLAGRFGSVVPWWGNFLVLTPTWGMLSVLVLVVAAGPPKKD